MKLIVCEGDSMTFGYGVAAGDKYPSQLATLLGGSWTVTNVGENSATLDTMTSDAASQVDSLYSGSNQYNILVLWGGTNDMYAGTNAATTISKLNTYCAARRTLGWKVIVVTILPRSHGGLPADFETSRQTVNGSVRSNYLSYAHAMADVAADNRIGDPGDDTNTTYYYGDLVHLSATGYGIIAQSVYAQILSIVGVVDMAASDARPIPRKNTAFRVTFPIFDADGDLVTGATGLDSEVSIDGGTFADCTNEATEIATSSGMYYLDLSSGEMNGDTVAIIVKTSTSGAKTTPIVMFPEELGDIRVDVGQISGDATAADNAEAFFDGTGYAGTGNVIPLVTTTTNVTTVNGLASGVINATAIASDAITAAKIADGAIDAATFAAGAITATVIATGAIDADAIAADAVTEIQSGLATQTSVDTIDDFLDTEIAAIKAKTDNLPASPANEATLTTIAGYLDTEVAAILAAVDTEVATLITNVAAILADTGTDGVALSTAVKQAIADEVLKRGVSNAEDTASAASLAELILLAMESSASGATLTIRKTTGATFSTRTLTLDAAAEPIVGIT